jgi:hypothetical protein
MQRIAMAAISAVAPRVPLRRYRQVPRLAKPLTDSPTLADVAELWQRALRAANRADKTRSTYGYALDRLAQHVGPDRPIDRIARQDHEELVGALLARGWRPASVSTVYRSL